MAYLWSRPQGATFGILAYLAQSNDNADCVDKNERFKFVDDLTILEVIDLVSVGLSSYDIKSHVPSDIPVHNGYIKKHKLESQKYLEKINSWTKKKKMILNLKKTKNMIFNCTKKYPFTTRLQIENTNIEVVKEMKLLGTKITDDLKWNSNTKMLVKKANSRIQLLQ